MLMHHFFGSSLIFLMAQGIIAYLSLVFSFYVLKKHCGWICMALCLSFLIIWYVKDTFFMLSINNNGLSLF